MSRVRLHHHRIPRGKRRGRVPARHRKRQREVALAPNTATGPMGTSLRRRSGLGSGWRWGWARSMAASSHEPSRTRAANILSWLAVRNRSPIRRCSGSAVSACARRIRSSPSRRISSAMRSRKAAIF
jgi:hypothetical protein